MSQNLWQKPLDQWSKEQRAKLPDNIRRLIRLISHDLYSGPIYEPDDGGDWPGFETACEEVKQAVELLNIRFDEVYYDVQSGEVFMGTPAGSMEENLFFDPSKEEDDETNPKTVWQEPAWDDLIHIPTLYVKKSFYGNSEIVPYV